jgi:hypothetical protein
VLPGDFYALTAALNDAFGSVQGLHSAPVEHLVLTRSIDSPLTMMSSTFSFNTSGFASSLEAAHKITILHQGYEPASDDFIKHAAAEQNPGIPIVKPAPPDPGLKSSKPAAEHTMKIEIQAKVTAGNLWVGHVLRVGA